MNTKSILFYAALIGIFYQCKTSQQIVFEDGKCYAKCLIQHNPNQDYEEYVVYTGNEMEEDVDLVSKEIVIQEKSMKWVKKKADRNCLSADPDDCLVWCLEDIPEKIEKFQVLVDTTQSDNYKLKKIFRTASPDQVKTTQLKEVMCEQDVTPSTISKIQNALKENHFYNGRLTGKLDLNTKKALTNFQKQNYLPIGQLDFETLDVLGIFITN